MSNTSGLMEAAGLRVRCVPYGSSLPRSNDHLFVNNVRFLSMASVVSMHCIWCVVDLARGSHSGSFVVYLAQPFKFGTIGFFLISGFLMGEGLSRRPPVEYLARRLRTVLLPWMVWVSLFWVLSLAHHWTPGELGFDSLGSEISFALNRLYICLFKTAYWFVPNLMLALCVLLLCRHFIDDLRLGSALMMASLFYSLNIYAQWVPVAGHSEALFGFVFYLWLGAWVARHFAEFEAWMAKVPLPAFVMLAILALLVAILESQLMSAQGVEDNLNTLRLSNQLYSMAAVLVIVKMRKAIWPHRLNVRATTFGIYLAHSVILAALATLGTWIVSKASVSGTWHPAPGWLACSFLGMFATVYGSSLGLTTILLKFPHLRSLVGAFPANDEHPASLAGTAAIELISLKP